MIYIFRCSGKVLVFISLLAFFYSHNVVRWNSKIHQITSSFTNSKSGLLAWILWYVCISKSQRILCVSFSRTNSGLCIYLLVVWWSFNLLHNSELIIFPNVFIPWMRFLLQSFALRSFLVFLIHSFLTFLPSTFVWWCSLPIFSSTCNFFFLQPLAVWL